MFNYTWETDPPGTIIDNGVMTSYIVSVIIILVVHYSDSASFGQNYSGCDLIEPFSAGPIPLVSNAVVNGESCFDLMMTWTT